jgi:hypothetical protein
MKPSALSSSAVGHGNVPSRSSPTVARTQASSAWRIACAYSSSIAKIRGNLGTSARTARRKASDDEISASRRAARCCSAAIARSRPSE